MRHSWRALAISVTIGLALVGRLEAETTTYSYDAKGRVKQVARTATAGNTNTLYSHDKANNRRAKVVTN